MYHIYNFRKTDLEGCIIENNGDECAKFLEESFSN